MAIIRFVKEKDYDELYELSLYLHNYCAKINPDLFRKKKAFSKKDKPKFGNCFVIEHNKKVIGFFEGYVLGSWPKNGKPCDYRYIVDTFVISEEYQNRKYGKKLFQFIEELACKKGCEKIILKTLNDERMLNFYNKMGMDISYLNLCKKIKPFDEEKRQSMRDIIKEKKKI